MSTTPTTPVTTDPSLVAGGVRHVAAGAGTELAGGPANLRVKVGSEHSSRFTLLEFTAAPGFAAPPRLHHHTEEDWAAYVTEGEVTFVFPDREIVAGPGDTVFVPVGADFAWRNGTDRTVRFLAIHAPAGFDRFFHDVLAGVGARGGQATPEVMGEVIPPLWDQYGLRARDEG